MASALMILFLGCWLAGQSRVSGGGTNLTQQGAAPTPTHPGSVGPGTNSGSRKSPLTPTQTEETDPSGTQQPDPRPTKQEGEDAGSIPAGGTDVTQSGTTPAPTHSGSTEPDGSASPVPAYPDRTCPTIIGLSTTAAVLLLLLLVAFVCFRKTRAIQQSNEDLLSATEQLQQ